MLNYNTLMANTAHAYDVLENEVLTLPREDRSKLATRLLESLDRDDELSPEWLEEIRRRAKDIDEGKTKLIPSEEVWKQVNERFGTDL